MTPFKPACRNTTNASWARAIVFALLFCATAVQAQASNPAAQPVPAPIAISHAGSEAALAYPRIQGVGGVLAVDAKADMPSTTAMHRLLIDISDDATTPAGINTRLEMAARALNLYAAAGVPDAKVRMAILLHGKATILALSDAVYARKFRHPHPDAELIAQLRAAGVELFVCGQALGHQGFTAADVRPEVRLALSAATKREELQAAGYAMVP